MCSKWTWTWKNRTLGKVLCLVLSFVLCFNNIVISVHYQYFIHFCSNAKDPNRTKKEGSIKIKRTKLQYINNCIIESSVFS